MESRELKGLSFDWCFGFGFKKLLSLSECTGYSAGCWIQRRDCAVL